MKTRYVALLDGIAGAYGVVVPDLPGCTAMGKTVEQALQNAVAAVRDWVDDAVRDGDAIPRPRPADRVRKDPDVAAALAEGAAIMIVPLIRETGRPAKANLSIDEGLLTSIDEAAAVRGMTRSAFIVSAAREKISTEG
jgi:predicted RNase H-like HicB family nuclease